MKRVFLGALFFLAAAPTQQVVIVGAEAWVGLGACLSGPCIQKIENATIVVEGGKIISIESGGIIPVRDGAEMVDAHGLIATVTLVDIGTNLGLPSLGGGDLGGEHLHGVGVLQAHGDGIPPESRGYSLYSVEDMDRGASHVKLARTGGLGRVLVRGVGWSGLVSLVGDSPFTYATVDQRDVAISLPWEGGSRGRERWEEWREDLLLWESDPDGYERGAMRTLSMPPSELRVVGRGLRGEIPVFVSVSDAEEILQVLDLGKRWGMRLILQNAEEAWVVADQIAEVGSIVLLDSEANLPSSFDQLGSRLENARILAQAGVGIIFSSFWSHNARRLRHKAGVAWAHGLPEALAWAAITEVPFVALGRAGGRLETGARADIALWEGHPMEFSGRLRGLMVSGTWVDISSRQDKLFERYQGMESH